MNPNAYHHALLSLGSDALHAVLLGALAVAALLVLSRARSTARYKAAAVLAAVALFVLAPRAALTVAGITAAVALPVAGAIGAGMWRRHRSAPHACAACGRPATMGDPLRFYRMQRRYPGPRTRLYRIPRYEVLRVHRSELADPETGLHRLAWVWWLS